MRKRDRGEKVAEEARPRTSGYESRRKSKGGRERERERESPVPGLDLYETRLSNGKRIICSRVIKSRP